MKTDSPFAGLGRDVDDALARGLTRVTGRAVGPYQTAVVRIGASLTWLLFLLREWPHRHQLYGPDGPWGWDLAERQISGSGSFTALMWTDSVLWFEVVYAGAVVASVLMLIGWRTRSISLLFMIGVLSLQNRNVFVGDGGDNVIHLLAIYLVATRCGQVWSLDARRAARGRGGRDLAGVVLWSVSGAALALITALGLLSSGWALALWGFLLGQAVWWAVRHRAPGEPRTVCEVIANLVHNGALLVILAEVCLIYATAGWYKIQGSHWQDGTALYYPLHLDDFTPWPGLSGILASSGLLVMVISYGTVITQVAFPFTLFNRRVKNVLLVLMMAEHAGIALVLGLPFFSLAMITADAVFLPTGFLVWAGARVSAPFRRCAAREGGGDPGSGGAADPGRAFPGQREPVEVGGAPGP